MEYYLKMPADDLETLTYESNLLGIDNGFGVFWAGSAPKALMNIVNNEPEALGSLKILTDTGRVYSIKEFLNNIQKLKVRIK